ncbi:chromosomal replication initiator DnaA [Rhodobacter sp. TJ_12]|uniref:DnaA ATPase domain-containing protein n=1 Tax=Rhodobacter sp. TJ_12 TaxID=2029399 RepID=UPI001CBD91B0|nr:DnaA/Hda family protein [Rhodobacter sp. TJ_12]MBZ4022222.1 chromosomal replication initiator DnaA [Rhodobacter sp. TJ_12]
MGRQMAFDLPVRHARGREDFFVAPANALALAALDTPDTWAAGRMLLIGPEGAGKTHLAAIWAEERNAELFDARALTDAAAERLAATGAVVIEDAQHLGGAPEAEEAAFHLVNLIAAEGGLLLFTADCPPRDWQMRLPDLKSRLEATTAVHIAPPDDALLGAVLGKLFADRQLIVPPTLVSWLVPRMERSLGTARALVAALDARALAERKPITRTMAGEVLDSLR